MTRPQKIQNLRTPARISHCWVFSRINKPWHINAIGSIITQSMIESGGISGDMEVPQLRGWFLKEKRDKFKRRGAGCNRRWFVIENIANPVDKGKSELALCYYKRSSENEDRCGWMFLNDVLSLSQDAAGKWITVEHPSRVLRIQSPTPAQHRVWFSTLSKCCKNIRDSSSSGSDRRPSLPHFMKAVSPSVRKKSVNEPVISTPKDELQFLREITGQRDQSDGPRGGQDDRSKGTKMFDDINTDLLSVSSNINSKEATWQISSAHCRSFATSTPRSIAELDATGHINNSPSQLELADSTTRIHLDTKNPTQSESTEEQKSEFEPLEYKGSGTEDDYEEVCSFNEDSVDSQDFSSDEATKAPAKKQFLLNAASNFDTTIQTFNMNVMRHALEKNEGSGASDDNDGSTEDTCQPLNENAFHLSTTFFQKNDTRPHVSGSTKKGQSFSSAHTLYSRSSSYQLHFENDDHDIKPDKNFVTDDWDE